MAEENKVEEQPQFTEIEQRAADQGWRPKDEWDGDPEAWRPAKEFLDRGELFKKIDDQNRTIKEMRKALDDLAKHHSKVAEAEYKRALDSLKEKKKEALIENDVDKVLDIDERIEAVREAQRTAPAVQVQPSPELNPIFVAWKDRNSWYDTNEAMRAYADRIGNSITGMSPSELLSEVERRVKKEFSHRFENAKRNQPSAVEGSTNKGSKVEDKFQLSDEQRRVANRFIKTIPGYTMEKYIEELKKVQDR